MYLIATCILPGWNGSSWRTLNLNKHQGRKCRMAKVVLKACPAIDYIPDMHVFIATSV